MSASVPKKRVAQVSNSGDGGSDSQKKAGKLDPEVKRYLEEDADPEIREAFMEIQEIDERSQKRQNQRGFQKAQHQQNMKKAGLDGSYRTSFVL